jgi:hypothetical protein
VPVPPRVIYTSNQPYNQPIDTHPMDAVTRERHPARLLDPEPQRN